LDVKGNTAGALELLTVAGIVALRRGVQWFLLLTLNSKKAGSQEPVLGREANQLQCSDISYLSSDFILVIFRK